MNITIDTNSVDFAQIDGKTCNFQDLDEKLMEVIMQKNIDINEYSISNKYLRGIVRKGGHEYHILEKTCGITPIFCVAESRSSKKELKIDLPYTILILKLKYMNGEYKQIGDRVFHSDVPVNKDMTNTLWRWSLSNVYPSHNICWGNEKLPQVDTQTTYKMVDEFFLAAKNYDLLENKNIDWKTMKSDQLYKVELKQLKKQPFNLRDAINQF